jgi:predicted dinucleotide-utilizing enzyme
MKVVRGGNEKEKRKIGIVGKGRVRERVIRVRSTKEQRRKMESCTIMRRKEERAKKERKRERKGGERV